MRTVKVTMRGGRQLVLTAASAAAVLVAGACGGDDDEQGGSETPASSTAAAGAEADPTPETETDPTRKTEVEIQMTDAFRFEPGKVVLRAGGKVTWTNPSTVVHTATGDPTKVADGANVELPPGVDPWDSGFLSGKGTVAQVFTVPGTYRYACIPHENLKMFGTIEVVP